MLTGAELRARELEHREMPIVARANWVRLISKQIDDGTYDEESALPVVAERLAGELEDDAG